MKIFKIIYYIFIGFIAVIAGLLIVSVFPITGNYKLMIVQSGSMTPAIKLGSLVLVKPVSEYKVGNIISFQNPENPLQPITHRIAEIKMKDNEQSFITKGDANNAPDQREISKREILGKVLFSVPFIGYAVDFAKKPLGFMLLIIVPAVIIIYDEIKKIINEVKKGKKKESVINQ